MTQPDTFDLDDCEAMQQVINSAAHAMAERIEYLEHELETSRARHASYQPLVDLAEWISDAADAEVLLDATELFSRARNARDTWSGAGKGSSS